MPTRVMLRTSERATYKRCRQRWDWAFNKKLKAKRESPALRFGSLVHEALAIYYPPGLKRGPHPAKTFKRLYKEETKNSFNFGQRSEGDEWVEAGDLGVDMLTRYVETYGDDGDIDIIAPEVPFEIDVFDPKTKEYIVTYVGIFDALYRHRKTRSVGLLEHKTAKSITISHLALDEQAGSYWAFAPRWLRQQGIIEKNETIEHIMYNFLRKAMRDERQQNEEGLYLNLNGTVSKVQPAPYFLRHAVYRDDADRKTIMRRIRAEAREMAMVRAGKLDVYKNPTRDCSWDCQFFDMCELHETGADWKSTAALMFKKWDPYAEHEGW